MITKYYSPMSYSIFIHFQLNHSIWAAGQNQGATQNKKKYNRIHGHVRFTKTSSDSRLIAFAHKIFYNLRQRIALVERKKKIVSLVTKKGVRNQNQFRVGEICSPNEGVFKTAIRPDDCHLAICQNIRSPSNFGTRADGWSFDAQ